MVHAAIIGGGVVGSGVFEVIEKNGKRIARQAGDQIVVKRVLDIKTFDPPIYGDKLTSSAADVFEDPSICIVAETMGGAGIAYEYTKKALQAGKHVVTSNKELVAKHGPELLQIAKDHQVRYLFEASVGGGIPIIRPLHQCLAANEIYEIVGILNGTTNYILTMMQKEGKDFATALKDAQTNGYAEADPTADVEGIDACRKLAILSSIVFQEYVDSDCIYTEGIANITVEDLQYAEQLGMKIKLIAHAKKISCESETDDSSTKIFTRVSPLMIDKCDPLAGVEDVFNAIVVKGDAIGEAMFYGRGAGKLPTASAVVADMIDIVRNPQQNGCSTWELPEQDNVLPIEKCAVNMFIRMVTKNDTSEYHDKIANIFGKVRYVSLDRAPKQEIAFLTDEFTEQDMKNALAQLKSSDCVQDVVSCIRYL